ncbi:Zinc-finger double-stranded RNA-binding domain- containing protein [Babesia divergens]|uniref:Zinc-finger double-stranded RNA-binding domain-containing protein n=1 Tax=Babesia divergens TaxID=32595 RepID=A0AAD9GHJ0_BABDI|nr:Zinc-finger double-stranded RNA-binding domain- containing protein [Babesia divergens]
MDPSKPAPPPAQPSSKVDALGRKVWDKSYYAKLADSKTGDAGDTVEQTISALLPGPSRKPIVTVPEVRENLKRRTETVDVTKDVGKVRIISALTHKSQQGGFYCKVCDCLLKDSQAYLDHLNGRKHNRMLGMTMRVEKVDAKTVAEALRRRAMQESVPKQDVEDLEKDVQERIRELEAEEREMKQRRKMNKKLKHGGKTEHIKVKTEPCIKQEHPEDETAELMKAMGLPTSF